MDDGAIPAKFCLTKGKGSFESICPRRFARTSMRRLPLLLIHLLKTGSSKVEMQTAYQKKAT